MTDLKDSPVCVCNRNQFATEQGRISQRLLTQHMATGIQCQFRRVIMRNGWAGDRDRLTRLDQGFRARKCLGIQRCRQFVCALRVRVIHAYQMRTIRCGVLTGMMPAKNAGADYPGFQLCIVCCHDCGATCMGQTNAQQICASRFVAVF